MTASSESEYEADVNLYAVVLAMQRGATEDLVHAVADCGLSHNKLKLLHVLARPHRIPPRISRVAQLIGISSAGATKLVRELDDERLVDRIDDERDGRSKRVVITERGREELERLDRPRLQQLARFRGTLTTEQRRALDGAARDLATRPEIAALRPET
jgi:DNA-binding MarR family transcriptional regulator